MGHILHHPKEDHQDRRLPGTYSPCLYHRSSLVRDFRWWVVSCISARAYILWISVILMKCCDKCPNMFARVASMS